MKLTCRTERCVIALLIITLLPGFSAALGPNGAGRSQRQSAAVSLRWLGGAAPGTRVGVNFGVPWPKGEIQKGDSLTMTTANGTAIPIQTWPLAYWPDGSLKWTGHAVTGGPGLEGPLNLVRGAPAQTSVALKAVQTDASIDIDTGAIQCRIPRRGSTFIESLVIGGRQIAKDARLVALREDRSAYDSSGTLREERFASQITNAGLEQSGPVRAVVKIEGVHKATLSARTWLPFTLRLYFYAGSSSARLVHSFVFDGDQEKDFIRGLGLRFSVPMREQFHNRHVRLAGETGMFAEPVRVISGRRSPGPDLYAKQIAGRPLPNLESLPGKENIEMMAVWDGYKLVQTSADSFSIQKRTGSHSSWIAAAGGRRALGAAFVGDTTGGLAVGMKNFWQLAPTQLEIEKASTDSAEMTAWLWSPDVPAMDLRHYDVKEHGLEASYEDITEGFSTATGVARTSELTLRLFDETPTNEEMLKMSRTIAQAPQLVCTPEYYHSIPVFGVWSLPDVSTPGKKWIEDQLGSAIAFYQGQVEQRRWYGFWDYGDVMHSYDPARHEWRYDVGGFAWANTELMPDLWLWYSFLRTGRADIFRMAEAMTRHTQEVDVYHLGRLAGLGSRHNVRHWGDGAKEVRVSQALLKRFYYYLTADERTGDLMNEVINVDYKLVEVDPLRKIEPKTQYPTHARVGPDWFALCGNWLVAWERTGDTKYRDKIITGMKCMAAMPHKLFSGDSYGYDPKSGKLYHLHDQVAVPHLAALMGGPELSFEMTPLIGLPEWTDAWLNYCEYLQAPREEQVKVLGGPVDNGRGPHYSKMTAFAAFVKQDAKLASRAWQEFLGNPQRGRAPFAAKRLDGADVPSSVDEIPGVSTNNAAQWSLNAIELLELVGKHLPENDARWSAAGR
ncbi:MAG TPA: Tat pathway signal sequence domain protein [Blastocatellia bacterium]|nr:Tat pathway signal sequence domain protein [Blastocatellia bacterium]